MVGFAPSMTPVPEVFRGGGEPCSDRGYRTPAGAGGGKGTTQSFRPQVNSERFVKAAAMNYEKLNERIRI